MFQLEPPLHPSFQVIRHGRRPVHDGDGPTAAAILASEASNLLEQLRVVWSEEKYGVIQFRGQVHLVIRQSTSRLGYRTGYKWRRPRESTGMERDTRFADALVCDDLTRTRPSQNPFQIVPRTG